MVVSELPRTLRYRFAELAGFVSVRCTVVVAYHPISDIRQNYVLTSSQSVLRGWRTLSRYVLFWRSFIFLAHPRSVKLQLGDALATRLNAARSTANSELDDPCRIWLGGLPPRTTEFAVIQLVRQFGQPTDFRFPVHRAGENQGSTVGYCFVSYATPAVAQKALIA